MQVKCNPLWNICDKSAWVLPIVSVVFSCLILFIEVWSVAISMVVFLIIANVVVLFTNYPRAFELWQGRLQYNRDFHMRRRFGGKNRKVVRTTLTVSHIESVELRQNALEKLFNTGRVIFTGHAEVAFLRDYSDFYTDQVSAPYHHTFYGIKHFDKFRNEIYDHVDPAILQIHAS